MIDPDRLLVQAERLIDGGLGPPGEEEFRRAVATAYDAVFHAGLIAGADLFVGASERGSDRYALVYRSVDHVRFRSLCAECARAKPTAKYERYHPLAGYGADLTGYADTFVDLYEKRIRSDYDPSARFTRSDGDVAIRTARDALLRIAAADPGVLRVFLTLLLFPPR